MKGILLIDKPKGKTSFYLVSLLRKRLNVRKIGHAGTLDPFATGVMVMLIGKEYTRMQPQFLKANKQYTCRLMLGAATDSYDLDGKIVQTSTIKPSLEEIQEAMKDFQGEIEQIPPMFSAKKIQGRKLYDLARKGIEVERKPKSIWVEITLLSYNYPHLDLSISCSSGTYIRSLAHDLGIKLGCFAHLIELTRTKSGQFALDQCISVDNILDPNCDLHENLLFH